MERYSALWGRLIIFLIRVQQHEDDTLAERLFTEEDPIEDLVDQVSIAAEELHAANPDGRTLDDCIRGKEAGARSVRPHAKTLVVAVNRLSVRLVKQLREQDPFSIAVVAFSATCVLDKYGGWVDAAGFRPFLSGMIHCMQLFLLGDCLQEYKETSGLAEYTSDQCQRYLVNTTAGAIAELSCWRLISKSPRNDTPRPPMTTMTEDCMQVNHADLELRIPAWRRFLREAFNEAVGILDDELLFDIPGLRVFPVDTLRDNLVDFTPGWSFRDDVRNGLHAVKDDVLNHLLRDPDLQVRFFELPTSEASSDEVAYDRPSIDEYLHANRRFLQLIAVLTIMTAGLPARRKELLGISWCNQEAPRNVYICNGLLAIFTGYHKSQWRVGTRPIARFLPPCIGDLVVRYLIYVPSVLSFFNHCMQRSIPRGFLFAEETQPWTPRQLSTATKTLTRRLLGIPIYLRVWRHIAIAIDRRLLQGISGQVYGITPDDMAQDHYDDSDSDQDDWSYPSRSRPNASLTASSLHPLQAAHTPETNAGHYGNSPYPFARLTDTLIADFCNVSRQWHQLCQLPSLELVACSRKRPISASAEQPSLAKKPSHGSRLLVRRQLWNWPAIKQGLRKLFGPTATPRDRMQRDALRLIASSKPESIIIMPTGSGKTVLYVVMSAVIMAEVTIVIMPLVALRQDLIRRCTEWGIKYWQYNRGDQMHERLHAVPSLVFVDVDTAVTSTFITFVKQLSDIDRLDRLILDEAHLVVTASDYRENLGLLAILRQIPCPLVCLTATLPPIAEFDLRQSLFMSHPAIHRVSSDRPQLEYCVESAASLVRLQAPESQHGSQDELLIRAAGIIYVRDLETWGSSDASDTARSIYFVRSKRIGVAIAQRLGCQFYHGGLSPAERTFILTAWS